MQELLFSGAAPAPTPSPAPVYATTTQLVSLRQYKSTTSARLALIPSNKQVVVLTASDGTWTRVNYASKTGYALSKYLTVSP